MPIQYALFENNLTADPDDYAAIVQMSGTADGKALVQDIIDQGTTVNRPDILAVTAALKLACQRRVEDGQRVNYFGMVEFFPRVKGVFTGAMDTFDPARHQIDIGANPGSELRDVVRAGATVQKVEALKPAPNPIEYRDIGSDTTNDQVTVGNIGQLSGSRLKYDPAQADEGVFFVATAGGDTKVATIQKNKPSQSVFLVPAALLAGTYNLEVRARIGGGTELRTGRLDTVLTI